MKKVFKPVNASTDTQYAESLTSDIESKVNDLLSRLTESHTLSSASVEWSSYDDSELEDNGYLKITLDIGVDL